LLIIEVLSPSTERHDRRVKLAAYRQIETVQEIVLIASDEIYAELHRRTRQQWVTEILHGGNAILGLKSAGTEVPLGDLYEGIALGEEAG
jgi:Uma2 family endonuclease